MTAHTSTEIRSLWVTRAEYARIAGVSERTIFDWEAKGVGPMPNRDVPGVCLYPRYKVESFVAERNGAKVVPAPAKPVMPPTGSALAEAVRPARAIAANPTADSAAFAADRKRAAMIIARAPSGFEQVAQAAIRDGVSLEAFNASLPGHYRAVLPPLHKFIADFDRPDDGGITAADSIIAAARAARRN